MSSKKSALSYHDARATFDRVDPILRNVERQRSELLASDPALEAAKIEDLKTGYALALKALKDLEKERTSTSVHSAPTPDLDKRIETVSTTLQKLEKSISALEKLLVIDESIAEYTAALQEPIDVLQRMHEKKQEIPEEIITDEKAYEATLQGKKTAETKSRASRFMDAVEGIEKTVLPRWEQILWSLNQHTIAEHRGDPFADNQFAMLDIDTVKQMLVALKKFPETPKNTEYLAKVEKRLMAYALSYKEYTTARDADEKRTAIRLMTTELLPNFIALSELGDMGANAIKQLKLRHQEDLAIIRADHAPEIAEAESQLFARLSTANDREHLINLRMGEAPAVPEHPILEKLKTPEGQKEVVDKILSHLGVPVTVEAVKERYEELKKDVKAYPIAIGKKAKTAGDVNRETDAWEAMRQNAALFLNAATLSKIACDLTKERVKRLSISGGDENLVKILSKGLFPENDASNIDPKTKLNEVVVAYIKELPPIVNATSPDIAQKSMEAALEKLNELRKKFGQLLSGEIQDAQAKSGVAQANRAFPKEEYLRMFVDAENGTTPSTPPDTRRKEAEASVNEFVTSMEHAATLEKEEDTLQSARNRVRDAYLSGLRYAYRLNDLKTELKTAESTAQALADLRLKRGFAGEDTTAATLRNDLTKNWNRIHEKDVADKTSAEKTAKTALTKAEQELEAVKKNPHRAQLDQQTAAIEKILVTLEDGDLSSFFTRDEKRDALLKKIAIQVGVGAQKQTLSALGLINIVAAQQSKTPIASFPEWTPPILRKLNFSQLSGATDPVETVLYETYKAARSEAAPVCELAEWFEKNGTVSLLRVFSKADSNPSLLKKANELRTELKKSYDVVLLERDVAIERVRAARASTSKLALASANEASTALMNRAGAFKEIIMLLDRDLSDPKKVSDKEVLDHCIRGLAATIYQHTGEDVSNPSTTLNANAAGFRELTQSIQRLKGSTKPQDIQKLTHHIQADRIRFNDYASKIPPIFEHLKTGKSLTKADQTPQTLEEAYEELATMDVKEQTLTEAVKNAANRHQLAEEELAKKKVETIEAALAAFDLETQNEELALDPRGDIEKSYADLQTNLDIVKKMRQGSIQEWINAFEALATHYAAWLDKKETLLTLTGPTATESEKSAVGRISALDTKTLELFAAANPPAHPNAAEFTRWWESLTKEQRTVLGQVNAPDLFPSPT